MPGSLVGANSACAEVEQMLHPCCFVCASVSVGKGVGDQSCCTYGKRRRKKMSCPVGLLLYLAYAPFQ